MNETEYMKQLEARIAALEELIRHIHIDPGSGIEFENCTLTVECGSDCQLHLEDCDIGEINDAAINMEGCNIDEMNDCTANMEGCDVDEMNGCKINTDQIPEDDED